MRVTMAYTLQNKTWMDFFVEISDEKPDKKNMETAHGHLVKRPRSNVHRMLLGPLIKIFVTQMVTRMCQCQFEL